MARLSATSSAVDTNGHIKEPTTVPLSPEEKTSPTADAIKVPLPNTPKTPITADSDDEDTNPTSDAYPTPHDPTLARHGNRSLSSISLQAFFLGSMFALGAFSTYLFALQNDYVWRLPAFVTCLSAFHFMEFWTTAAYNTPACRASSFLLFNNGRAYTLANLFAAIEICVSWYFPRYMFTGVNVVTIVLGAGLVVMGQTVRSVAMIQAATNFNHIVQSERKGGHVLVKDGLYAYFRHPSYFGFFWWSIGTQLLVGNKVCLVCFVFVLYRFFSRRIAIEEEHLIEFFGDDYREYKKRTGTKIPLIP